MKERLLIFLDKEGLTALKFAELMEVQPSSISHLLSGRNNPNFDFISKMIKRFPRLNPDWIVNGEGGMYRDELSSEIAEPKPLFTNVIQADNEEHNVVQKASIKKVDRIMIFYTDKTFVEYRPSEE